MSIAPASSAGDGKLAAPGSAVTAERLGYTPDGALLPVTQTQAGISAAGR